MTTSEDPTETEWFNVSFEFKLTNADFDLDEMDLKIILTGLGRAMAFMTLPDDERKKVGIFVRNLSIREVPFLSDWAIDQAVEEFKKDLED